MSILTPPRQDTPVQGDLAGEETRGVPGGMTGERRKERRGFVSPRDIQNLVTAEEAPDGQDIRTLVQGQGKLFS